MEVRGQEITSICLMNVEDDGSIVGTVVNEMGVKAFDFTYANGKAKVINVLGPLNKWYIRMVLQKDFSFILSNIDRRQNVVHKKRSMTVTPEGDIAQGSYSAKGAVIPGGYNDDGKTIEYEVRELSITKTDDSVIEVTGLTGSVNVQ